MTVPRLAHVPEVEYGWGGRLIDDRVWRVQHHDRGALGGHKVPVPAAA